MTGWMEKEAGKKKGRRERRKENKKKGKGKEGRRNVIGQDISKQLFLKSMRFIDECKTLLVGVQTQTNFLEGNLESLSKF